MINKILDFVARLALLLFFLAMIIATCYGVIFLGAVLLKWLKGFM